jgi:hypothetical protein
MLVETQNGGSALQQRGERRIAGLEGFAPHVLAVELDQVEGLRNTLASLRR